MYVSASFGSPTVFYGFPVHRHARENWPHARGDSGLRMGDAITGGSVAILGHVRAQPLVVFSVSCSVFKLVVGTDRIRMKQPQ